uniref:PID domain-containing protein n=1 Tax=Arion vulgaris TaxID=1028688 RepID=A0A0B7AC99_9EUPU
MNLFGWRKSINISEQDPTFKVRYLGNVQTTLMKGEGCVDRPTNIIWNNYLRSDNRGIDMTVVVTGSGMKAYTKEQGLTEYRAHRIPYCIAHPDFPRLFVWVYRHDGKKMKMEVRCHAVMCKTEAKAKTLALQLHQKLSCALKEFQREKLRKQNSRLTLQHTNTSSTSGSILPLRTQLLSTAKNFRPPVSKSPTAPKLGSITEDEEDECLGVDEEMTMIRIMRHHGLKRGSVGARMEGNNNNFDKMSSILERAESSAAQLFRNGVEHHNILEALDLESTDDTDYFNSDPIIDLEIGNDLDELQNDTGVKLCIRNSSDSDEESAESGYHDQEQDIAESEKERIKNKEILPAEDEEYAATVCHLPSFEQQCVLQANALTKKILS